MEEATQAAGAAQEDLVLTLERKRFMDNFSSTQAIDNETVVNVQAAVQYAAEREVNKETAQSQQRSAPAAEKPNPQPEILANVADEPAPKPVEKPKPQSEILANAADEPAPKPVDKSKPQSEILANVTDKPAPKPVEKPKPQSEIPANAADRQMMRQDRMEQLSLRREQQRMAMATQAEELGLSSQPETVSPNAAGKGQSGSKGPDEGHGDHKASPRARAFLEGLEGKSNEIEEWAKKRIDEIGQEYRQREGELNNNQLEGRPSTSGQQPQAGTALGKTAEHLVSWASNLANSLVDATEKGLAGIVEGLKAADIAHDGGVVLSA